MTWTSAEHPDLYWEFTSNKVKDEYIWKKASEIWKGFVYLDDRLVDPVKENQLIGI